MVIVKTLTGLGIFINKKKQYKRIIGRFMHPNQNFFFAFLKTFMNISLKLFQWYILNSAIKNIEAWFITSRLWMVRYNTVSFIFNSRDIVNLHNNSYFIYVFNLKYFFLWKEFILLYTFYNRNIILFLFGKNTKITDCCS